MSLSMAMPKLYRPRWLSLSFSITLVSHRFLKCLLWIECSLEENRTWNGRSEGDRGESTQSESDGGERWAKWSSENRVETREKSRWTNCEIPMWVFLSQTINKYWFRKWMRNTYFWNILDGRTLALALLGYIANGIQIATISMLFMSCNKQRHPLKVPKQLFACVCPAVCSEYIRHHFHNKFCAENQASKQAKQFHSKIKCSEILLQQRRS